MSEEEKKNGPSINAHTIVVVGTLIAVGGVILAFWGHYHVPAKNESAEAYGIMAVLGGMLVCAVGRLASKQ